MSIAYGGFESIQHGVDRASWNDFLMGKYSLSIDEAVTIRRLISSRI